MEISLSPRMPPTNIGAEQALLGALLANNKTYAKVRDFLRPEHFADTINGKIYASIARKIEAGQLADAITLRGEFENSGVLQEVGGTAYLVQLLGAMVGIINAGEYGKAIYDHWLRRELIDAGETLVNDCFSPVDGVTGADILAVGEDRLRQIAQGVATEITGTSAADSIKLAIENGKRAMLRGTGLAGITTGYPGLDRLTSGFQAQQLIIVGARPSMGKTSLGLGMATRAAASGANVAFWSGEMAEEQLGMRLAAAATGIPTQVVNSGSFWEDPRIGGRGMVPLTVGQWAILEEARRQAEELPLTFSSEPNMTVSRLRAWAMRLKRQGKLDLLVIDYAGLLMPPPELRARSKYEQMSAISGGLMALKAELGVPIVVLVQLSRANEAREDKLPDLSDLRDTGAWEQDASAVMFIHRPHYYISRKVPQRKPGEDDHEFNERQLQWSDECRATEGHGILLVAKQRNGPTGAIEIQYHDQTTWFRDASEASHSPAWEFERKVHYFQGAGK